MPEKVVKSTPTIKCQISLQVVVFPPTLKSSVFESLQVVGFPHTLISSVFESLQVSGFPHFLISCFLLGFLGRKRGENAVEMSKTG